jgi:hypothetical protein
MATSRRKIKALTDLNAKQILQKVDGNDVIFEASGSLASGRVSSSVPLTASALVSTSTISGSGHLTVGSAFIRTDLEVSGNLTVRGTPTIISSDVLEVKDNIIVVNKPSGSTDPFVAETGGLYVYRGSQQSASLLWVSSSNDWQLGYTSAGSTLQADLSINKLKVLTISGSAGVGVSSQLKVASPLLLKTTASFDNFTVATSSITVEGNTTTAVDVEKALHSIDTAIGTVATSANILNAYRRLRYQFSGTLDVNGEADVVLPTTQLGGNAFPTASLSYITTDVMVWDSDRWVNDLVAVDVLVSASAVHVLVSAAASPNTPFRLITVNESTSSYTTA